MPSHQDIYNIYNDIIKELSSLPYYADDDGAFAAPEWMIYAIIERLEAKRNEAARLIRWDTVDDLVEDM